MQRVLLNFAGGIMLSRKLSILLPILFACGFINAQSSGIFESYAILSINGGGNAYYDMQAVTGNPDFQGANLGTFVFGTNSLIVRGGQNKTFKNGGCNINSSKINYRVYKTGNTPGSFIQINEPFLANLGGGGDQSWEGTSGNTNLIAGLTPGNYTLEVYSEAGYDSCGSGTHFSSNFGNNYKATFTVTSANPVFVTSAGGTSTIAGYPTLAAALTAINGGTVHTGTITCLVAAGHNENTPVGGYSITASGTAASPITFIKDGAGANPTFTAPGQTAGALNDAIFKIIGSDYITIDGFTMLENASNTTTTAASNNMTEFGVALFYASTTNGAQNCTIKNCTIDLNRTYQNTWGIYSNSTHSASTISTSASATTAAGANSNLTITGNTITDVNQGILVIGPTAASDNNDGLMIGGSVANANSITNFGTTNSFSGYVNVSGTINGILVRNTKNVTVSNNTIASSVGGAATGTLRGIYMPGFSNSPTGTNSINLNSNSISLRSGSGSAPMLGIEVESSAGNTTTTVNINANDFNNFGHTVASSGAITFISDSVAASTGSLSNNTFTNISVNTTGNVTFFNSGYAVPAGGTKNMNGNSIVTGFSKTGAGGTLTIYSDNSSSTAGTVNNNNNNFSNITVTGATSILGWINTDGSSTNTVAKSVSGNTFSNWTGGSNSITAIRVGFSGTGTVSNNVVSNITGGSAIIGIELTSNAQNATGNTIHSLATTGGSAVSGIVVSAGATNAVASNKIYNLEANNASGTVNGILISSGTTTNVQNNLIGDLRTPLANASNPLNGINVTGGTTVNVYYNTVLLNGTSAGALFGSSAISASTSPTLVLRNNIFVNNSAISGAGRAAAYRRSSTALANYGAASNNNLFFGSTIFTDGTNTDVVFSAYKTRVASRDAASVSESPTFLSTSGASANFLHIDPAVATGIESGGTAISGITTDFDGQTRNATTPDIGADEGNFTSNPQMTYVSSTCSQLTGSFCPSSTNVQVLRMEVVTANAGQPLTLSSLTISANGTTDLADIATYRIYYTGTSSTFATSTPIIAATPGLTASPTVVTPSSTVALAAGTNYFWLVYNLNSTITGSVVDAEFTNVALSTGGGVPTVTAPAGAVNVFAAPTAVASSNSPVCSGGPIQLTGTSDIGTTFLWTGPNSFSSTEQNPVINNAVAANAGIYSFTATANGCSSAVSTTTVVVNATPPAPTTTNYNVCAGGSVPAGQGLTSTAVGSSSTVAGSQTINFTVNSQPSEVNFGPGNVVAMATMSPLPAGATVTGITINYNGLTALGGSWRSDIRLGLSGAVINAADLDPLAPLSAGTFNYARTATTGITVNNAGGTVNLLYWDNVNDNGGAEATFPTGTSVASVTVNYSYSDPASVQWYNAATNGTLIGTGSPFNPIGVDPALPNSNTSGTYTYYAQVSNGSCPSVRTAADFVIGAALSVNTAANPSAPVCAGTEINLSSSVTGGGGGFTYSWKVGATEVSTFASFTVTPTVTTIYDLTVTDACNATATSSVTVNVNPYAVITQQPVAPAAYCSGPGSATISVTATGASSYQWRRNGVAISDNATFSGSGTSILTINNATESNAGSYDVIVGASGNCNVTSGAVPFVVNPAAPSTTGVTVCQNGSGNLTAVGNCDGFGNPGTVISGSLLSTPTANRLASMTDSSVCSFGTTVNSYVASQFQVSVTGNYTFIMVQTGAFDGMGYLTSGAFTPGSCATGTFIKGDDDNGPDDEPSFTASLTTGVTYTLYTTTWAGATYPAAFTWNVAVPAGGQILTPFTGSIQWYTAAAGGSSIGAGTSFNPVGVAGSGLADTSNAGSITFYAACSANPTCRTPAVFTINTNVTYYADNDLDSFGDPNSAVTECDGDGPAGYVTIAGDCDDDDAAVNPNAQEICDGIDNDCDGLIDNADPSVIGQTTYYADSDNDGFGNNSVTILSCTVPVGYVANNTDCDDSDAAVNPNAQEICDGIDNDCDGLTDNADPSVSGQTTYYADSDNDGFGNISVTIQSCTIPAGYVANSSDCDDSNAAINPNAQEICDGIDNDCDGFIDDADPSTTGGTTFYADADGDGFGNPNVTQSACSAPAGFVSNNSDCDDSSAAINPNAQEVCDGIDNDCDGLTDNADPSVTGQTTYYADADNDGFGNNNVTILSCSLPAGYVANNSDCNDNNAAINPNAQEICDGIDNDCDGLTDNADPSVTGQTTYYADADNDGFGNNNVTILSCSLPAGYVANNSDCNDNNAAINPNAQEVCDGIDNDCDGLTDDADPSATGGTTYYADADNDGFGNSSVTIQSCSAPAGYVSNSTDCDDTKAGVNPGASEIGYNLIDDDCDGLTDEGFPVKATVPAAATCGTILNTIDQTIYAGLVSGAQGYQWRVTTISGPGAGQIQLLNTPLRQMKLTQLANYAYAATYKIEVAVYMQGSNGQGIFLQPYTATNCTVSTPTALTQLTTCGQTLITMNDVIFANAVSFTSGYRFRITDPLNPTNTQTIDRPVREFRMNFITNFTIQYNKTYQVQVAVRNTDGNYLPFGPICNVTTPLFPTTGLRNAQCDNGVGGPYAVPSMSTQIFADSYPGAIAYVFRLSGGGLAVPIEVTKPLRVFTLNEFAGMGIVPGSTYNVNVRLIFNNTDPVGPYGKTCSLTVPGGSRIKSVDFDATAYPNPFAESFNIDLETAVNDKVGIKVYDMTGRLLEEMTATVSETETMNLGNRYPAGVYNVIVTQDGEVKTLRVIKR